MGKAPSTPATRLLRERGVPYTEHLYRDLAAILSPTPVEVAIEG